MLRTLTAACMHTALNLFALIALAELARQDRDHTR
ncbi:hypothetical protein METH_07580 [Leisingera methylohalidivorans DSM 14336]|uniref:Uncharacterized protein n=1 Tax=Leisingera methylohalidivorans DSM 14336 TaxID=999552 RepID=V9VYF3_9RHOB|nr:hypothetical protein METH_07580 [Leisingera methylohalidivorans DSM 14336]